MRINKFIITVRTQDKRNRKTENWFLIVSRSLENVRNLNTKTKLCNLRGVIELTSPRWFTNQNK